jgi:hypothetical protein
MKFKSTYLAAAAILLATSGLQAAVIISEVNSNGTGGDFFEIYNAGVTTVDLGGWKWVDNASVGNGGADFNGARAYAFDAFSLSPGQAVIVVTDASGGSAGNTAFRNSWGLSESVPMLTFTVPSGTGNGLGQNDLIALFNSSGVFVAGVNYGTVGVNITQDNTSEITLDPFAGSLGGHAGSAGGGAAQASLVWDGVSALSPAYTVAVVGVNGAFEHPSSAVTIGSPGVIPEPSTALLGGLGLLALLRRSRK